MERSDLHLLEKRKFKHISCPKCGRRVADAAGEVSTEVYEITQTATWKADYYMKCWNCKTVIGLKKLNQVS